jgi:hypothetical protein
MTLTFVRLAVGLMALGSTGALAQQGGPPPPAVGNPVCTRLEAQLATIDRGGNADPARAEQTRRYEDSVNRQQQELDRTVAQSRRLGCDSGGFFSLFGGGQNPQCQQVTQQIQQMRGNLDKMLPELQRLQSGGGERDQQRQTVLAALGQNNCGPQYRQAAVQPRGFFDSLFGGNNRNAPDGGGGVTPNGALPDMQNSTFRTLCVRTCDGYYFPVSFSANQSKFRDDEQVCQRTCPGTETVLVTHRNPGEDITQAVTLSGQPYSGLPNAFKYRTSFDAACSCRRAGQSWADALGAIKDTTVERGDIVVTEERSKALSVPLDSKGRPIAAAQAKKPDPKATGATPAAADQPDDAAADAPKRAVRSVGPTFVAQPPAAR